MLEDSIKEEQTIQLEEIQSKPSTLNIIIKNVAAIGTTPGVALLVLVLLFWGILWGLFGSAALPGGHLFALVAVISCSYIGGLLVTVLKCPPLLGMLLLGFSLRNLFPVTIGESLDPFFSSVLRSAALVVILLRAGLGLDPKVLKKLSFVCFRLAFIPCLVEALSVGIAAHFLLDLPWLWSFMLGFVLGAVSPAVVVPSMLALEAKQLGTDKGIPTLVIAAASVDDVLAITGFGIMLGVTFAQGNLTWTIFKGPVEAIIGILYGLGLGWAFWHMPSIKSSNIWLFRASLLLFGGFFIMFSSQQADFPGVGALGCLSLSFVSALKWRQDESWAIDGIENNLVITTMDILWKILQPALFGLIGAELQISQMQKETVGMGLATLACGLIPRLVASFVAVSGGNFTLKERIFISLAWIPKATVQAAIGPVALDLARSLSLDPEQEVLGIQILTIAVLSILVTAPLGALAVALSAPKLLKANTPEVFNSD